MLIGKGNLENVRQVEILRKDTLQLGRIDPMNIITYKSVFKMKADVGSFVAPLYSHITSGKLLNLFRLVSAYL